MPDRTEWQKIGRRSRSKGKDRQRQLRKFLETMFAIESPQGVDVQKMGNEEDWTHLPVRVELKAGDQVRVAMSRYHEARTQWEGGLADPRPFMYVLRPDGERMNYFMMSGEDLISICDIYFEMWAGGDADEPDES